jgi:Ulp1 family protease
MLMFPIHIRNHWILAVVNFRKKQIVMYDSFRKSHLRKLNELLAVLKGEAERLKMKVDFTCWVVVNGLSPKQSNCDDCGMFACTTAVYLAQNLPLVYTQENISLFRLKMARDLRRGFLDPKTSN